MPGVLLVPESKAHDHYRKEVEACAKGIRSKVDTKDAELIRRMVNDSAPWKEWSPRKVLTMYAGQRPGTWQLGLSAMIMGGTGGPVSGRLVHRFVHDVIKEVMGPGKPEVREDGAVRGNVKIYQARLSGSRQLDVTLVDMGGYLSVATRFIENGRLSDSGSNDVRSVKDMKELAKELDGKYGELDRFKELAVVILTLKEVAPRYFSGAYENDPSFWCGPWGEPGVS